jgi:hypothetical protein
MKYKDRNFDAKRNIGGYFGAIYFLFICLKLFVLNKNNFFAKKEMILSCGFKKKMLPLHQQKKTR